MNREFLELYNRELQLLYERSKQFAEEFPGVAERLGGLTGETMDPGLVERAAGQRLHGGARAAQAEERIRRNSPPRCSTSCCRTIWRRSRRRRWCRPTPPYDDPGPRRGQALSRAATISTRSMSSRSAASPAAFGCARDLALWPLHLEMAEYYAAPAPLQALGLEVAPGIASGLRLGFRRLSAPPGSEKAERRTSPNAPVKDIKVDSLPVHILGPANDAIAVYEQLFANCRRITHPLPRFLRRPAASSAAPLHMLEQIGFGENETLVESDDRVFSGFNLLLDFFTFPNKFLGFRLHGPAQAAVAGSTRRPSTSSSNSARPCRGLQSVVRPGDVRALRRAGRQSVRDELQPRAGAAQRT